MIGKVPRDPAKPGAQLPGVAQTTQPPPGDEKGVLCQTFALAQLAGSAIRQGADESLVPSDNLAEGVAIARKALANQLGVVL